MFISFVLISFVIWFFKKFSKEYQEEIKMEIEIVDFPQSYIVSSISDSHINLNLYATGFQFLYYYFFDNTIKISFKKALYTNNVGYLEIASEFNKLQDQLLGDSQILSFFPSSIEIKYQPEFSKKIPVLQPKFNLDFGYSITGIKLDPDSVIVSGPKNLLFEIDHVNLNYKNESLINSNFFKKIPIKKLKKKLNYNFSEVNVELFVELFSEKNLTIPISVSNFPDDTVLKLFPSEVEVVFSSTLNNLKSTKPSDFKVGFNYDSIDKGKKKVEVKLINAPPNAQNIRLNPKNVYFLIRK
jgi:YbbR domain-containing protein